MYYSELKHISWTRKRLAQVTQQRFTRGTRASHTHKANLGTNVCHANDCVATTHAQYTDLKVHTPTNGVRACLHVDDKKIKGPRSCLHQSGERLPRPSPGLLSEKAHDAPEVLVQLPSPRKAGGLNWVRLENVHTPHISHQTICPFNTPNRSCQIPSSYTEQIRSDPSPVHTLSRPHQIRRQISPWREWRLCSLEMFPQS